MGTKGAQRVPEGVHSPGSGAWSREAGEVLQALEVEPGTGLSQAQADERLARFGPNELAGEKGPGLLRRLLAQLRDPMILVLLGAAGLSLWAGGGKDWLDSAIILGIVAVNAVLSISQEDSARRALEALKEMAAPTALVRREGALCRVEARALAPGDIVYLQAGDMIPADGRILTAVGLQVDESAMTGESVPVAKSTAKTAPETPLADRVNMALSGTMVVTGKGTMAVTATGMGTEMGRIAGLLGEKEEKTTPLQRKMGEISRTLSFLCLCVCGVMFGVGLLQGKTLLDMFLTAVSLAVAAIPEGLPAIVTIVLALGVQRLAKRGAIVTRLPAVETLGCAGVICSDKTGTLTRNRMEVTETWGLCKEGEREALRVFALCGNATLGPDGQVEGDPTEGALLRRAVEEGLSPRALEAACPRLAELPFDAQRKRMTTLHRTETGVRAMVKGAVDLLLERCDYAMTGRGKVPLTPELRRTIQRANQAMGARALRVLGAACRDFSALPRRAEPERVERGLTFLGLAGMIDPPRPEVKEAVARCHRAGIRPVMITGDHRATAVAIARELDILRPGEGAVTGEELDFMPQELLEEQVENLSVFARVTPEHKSRIVRAFQARGEVVAMTGDGVNDAPALGRSDIGCAMGKSGTQVARSASHLILTDDNFATIVSAVAEGRGIYANIRKAIHYLLSCNIGEILTLFAATALGFPQMPLLPVQLLWLNLVTDSLPALALGVEPVEPGMMERPPRRAGENLFDRKFSLRLLWQGIMVGGLTLTAYLLGGWVLGGPADPWGTANTMAFATLTLSQLFHAYNARSERESIFALGVFSNRAMNRAFLAGLAMQLAVLLIPALRGVFGTVALGGAEWLTVGALAVTPVAVCEVTKAVSARIRRRREKKREETCKSSG